MNEDKRLRWRKRLDIIVHLLYWTVLIIMLQFKLPFWQFFGVALVWLTTLIVAQVKIEDKFL